MIPEEETERAARVAAYAARWTKRFNEINNAPQPPRAGGKKLAVTGGNIETTTSTSRAPSQVTSKPPTSASGAKVGRFGGIAKEAKRLSRESEISKKRLRAESPGPESRGCSAVGSPETVSSTNSSLTGTTHKRSKSNSIARPLPISPSEERRALPDWYTKIIPERINWKKSSKYGSREAIPKLSQIGSLIRVAKETNGRPDFDKIRNEIHELEFVRVTAELLRKVDLLDNRRGLPQLFDEEYKDDLRVPWDIEADALELYNKWIQQMFDPDLLRGIITQPRTKDKSIQKKGWSFDPKFDRISPLYFGHGMLVNGQWWPRQICAVRDGAHGAPMAGITGIRDKGAVSVVMSGSDYHNQDQDDGEEVQYCGTESNEPGRPSDATKFLILSLENKRPVRLMRSSNIPNSRYKPCRGFRYDGLYDVVEKTLINKDKHHYRFHLVRQPGQAPIRYQGVEARPTTREILELQNAERILGMRGGWD